jgi:hypothetical protein
MAPADADAISRNGSMNSGAPPVRGRGQGACDEFILS